MQKLFILILSSVFLFSVQVYAQSGPQTSNDPLVLILQDGTKHYLTTEYLNNFSQMELTTTTPWNSEKRIFRGVTLSDLIKKYSNTPPKSVRLTALNDYVIEMPKKEWTDYHVLLATRANGEPISIRDKGPITIVFGRKASFYKFLLPNINDEKSPYLVWFLKKVELIK